MQTQWSRHDFSGCGWRTPGALEAVSRENLITNNLRGRGTEAVHGEFVTFFSKTLHISLIVI